MKQLAMEVKAAEADWCLCSSVLTKLWLRLFWFSSGSSPTQLRNDDVHSVVLRHYLVHSPDPTQTSFTNSSFLWPSRSQKTFSVDVGISLSCCICTSAASRSFHSRARSWVCFLTSTLNQDGCKTLALSLVAQRTACVREGQWRHLSTQLAIPLYLQLGIWRIPAQVLSALETGHCLLPLSWSTMQIFVVGCPGRDGPGKPGSIHGSQHPAAGQVVNGLCQLQLEWSHPGLY